jgi:hypothetical protein
MLNDEIVDCPARQIRSGIALCGGACVEFCEVN